MLDVVRARLLVAWARPWHAFDAKPLDPAEPALVPLVHELGQQLGDALDVIESMIREPAPPG